jgi:hypothetical protein
MKEISKSKNTFVNRLPLPGMRRACPVQLQGVQTLDWWQYPKLGDLRRFRPGRSQPVQRAGLFIFMNILLASYDRISNFDTQEYAILKPIP